MNTEPVGGGAGEGTGLTTPEPDRFLLAESIITAAPEGLVALDAQGRVVWANPASQRLIGWLPAGVPVWSAPDLAPLGSVIGSLSAPGGPPARRTLRLSGDREVEVVAVVRGVGTPAHGFLLTLRVPSWEDRTAWPARHDPQTGLLNRAALLHTMEQVAGQGGGVIAMLDIDGLHEINDRHGHQGGDDTIQAVARALRWVIADSGVVARVGGDEFGVLLPAVSLAEAEPLLTRVIQAVRGPLLVSGGSIRVSVSAGCAVLTAGRFPDHAFLRADRALELAKASGGNRYVLDGPAVQDWATDRGSLMAWLEALRAENVRLALEARTDALTGLPNLRALTEAERLLTDASYNVGVAFLDLDLFGDYNKLYGDAAGDRCLQSVATAMSASLRAEDQVFRKGGEEFVALLPGADAARATAAAERLRQAVESLGVAHAGTPSGRVTATVGVAVADSTSGPAGARERAAVLAFGAKKRGDRNGVHLSGQ